MTYPAYVPTLGFAEQCSPVPGIISGAMTNAFALKVANPAQLQATVDHFLNAPTHGAARYTVLGELIFVTFMHADRLTSGGEVNGWQPDDEMAFWVPLLVRGPTGQPDRIRMWMPYITISVSEGMTTGREIWGYFKQTGDVTVANHSADPMVFTAQALIYDPLASTSQGRTEPLVTITGPSEAGGLEALWHDVESFARGMHELWQGAHAQVPSGDGGLILDTLEHLLAGQVEVVNLKQFRDAADSTLACYQALIEGPCTIKALHGGGLLPAGSSATIANWASNPIASYLGLPTSGPIPVVFASWVKMDFEASNGREVWKATGSGEPSAPPGCLNLPALFRRLFAGNR